MSDEVLFQITRANLETGLRGVPVGYCTTSTVDPMKGLFYVGHPVSELADWEPEKVIYLLYSGKEGSSQEVEGFKKELRGRATLAPEVVRHLESLPRKGHPMALYSAALLIAGMIEGRGDYREDCLNLIAKIPILTAYLINYHAGWGKTKEPKPELGYMANFAYLLNLQSNNQNSELSRVLTLFNILHYDHGGGNLSTFVGKAVASGLEDLYG